MKKKRENVSSNLNKESIKQSRQFKVFIGILLVVFAGLIIYFAFAGKIKDFFIEMQTETPFEIIPGTVSYDGESLFLQVKKNPYDKEIIGVRFVVENGTDSYEFNESVIFEDGEIKDSTLNTKNFISNVNKVIIYPILKEETQIKDKNPAGLVFDNSSPVVSAYLDEVYQGKVEDLVTFYQQSGVNNKNVCLTHLINAPEQNLRTLLGTHHARARSCVLGSNCEDLVEPSEKIITVNDNLSSTDVVSTVSLNNSGLITSSTVTTSFIL